VPKAKADPKKPKAGPARAEKPKPKAKGAEAAPPLSADRKQRLAAITASINKQYGHNVIQDARQIESTYLLRRPTGILSLDIGLGGGFPASAPSVIVGPDGAGKDYLLWRICAQAQKTYGENFAMAVYLTEFRLDKKYMKDICGFRIAMSEAELDEEDAARVGAGLPPFTDAERAHYADQVGSICVIAGVTAEEGLDAIIAYVQSNACQIVAVNSIGFFQTEAKENTDSFKEFAQQRNEAMLLSKFMPKLAMTLNRDVSLGERNETTVLLINQVRSKDQQGRPMHGRPVLERDKYQSASNSWALKHGKAIELMIHNGKKHYDEAIGKLIGREKSWTLTKGKLGTHEGIGGTFDYWFEIGVDVLEDLIRTAKGLGVLETSGAWLSYTHDEHGFKAQGEDRARQHLQEHPEIVEHLREACFRAAKVVYRLH
jgi:RecA/RadA recombinase